LTVKVYYYCIKCRWICWCSCCGCYQIVILDAVQRCAPVQAMVIGGSHHDSAPIQTTAPCWTTIS